MSRKGIWNMDSRSLLLIKIKVWGVFAMSLREEEEVVVNCQLAWAGLTLVFFSGRGRFHDWMIVKPLVLSCNNVNTKQNTRPGEACRR